jgi:hypothetical protein
MGEVAVERGVVIVPVPVNTQIRITGLTNSGWWGQRIIVSPQWVQNGLQTWTGTGAQNNKIVGEITYPPCTDPNLAHLKIQMEYDSGGGFQLSQVETAQFQAMGLGGIVVGGQDGGGRPHGPAFTNTVAFVYFAPKY